MLFRSGVVIASPERAATGKGARDALHGQAATLDTRVEIATFPLLPDRPRANWSGALVVCGTAVRLTVPGL